MGEKKRRGDAQKLRDAVYAAAADPARDFHRPLDLGDPGGPEVFVAPIELTQGGRDMPPGPMDAIFCEVANRAEPRTLSRDYARQAAVWLAQVAATKPRAVLHVTVGGWDDDPREVPDIPEAVRQLRWFAERLKEVDVDNRVLNRLDTFTRKLLMHALGWLPREVFRFGAWTDEHLKQWSADKEYAAGYDARHEAEQAARAAEATKQ